MTTATKKNSVLKYGPATMTSMGALSIGISFGTAVGHNEFVMIFGLIFGFVAVLVGGAMLHDSD